VLVLLLALVARLASVTLLLGAIYVSWAWYMGELIAVAWTIAAGAAFLWSLLGRHIALLFHRKGTDDPLRHGTSEYLPGVHASILHVETERPAAAQCWCSPWGFDASALVPHPAAAEGRLPPSVVGLAGPRRVNVVRQWRLRT
jgi:hypothetical protein